MGTANLYNNCGRYAEAIHVYQQYLNKINQSQRSVAEINQSQSFPGIGRAFYNLAFAHYQSGSFVEAVEFYEKSAAVAEANGDKVALARCNCNSGLAHRQMGNVETALECQTRFLTLSRELRSVRGEFKALGNVGDLRAGQGRNELALAVYEEQLEVARTTEEPALVAQSLSSVGSTLRRLKRNDAALRYHAEEAEIYRDVLKDGRNEFKAQGRLGANLTLLEKYEEAKACYERQVEISSGKEEVSEARKMQALSNLAIARTNLNEFVEAVECLQQQLVLLTQKKSRDGDSREIPLKIYNVHYKMADCWFAAENYSASNEHFLKAYEIATGISRHDLTELCLESIVTTANIAGDLDRAVHFAKIRLENARTHLGDGFSVAAACGDLGVLLTQKGKFPDAVEHLKEQMKVGIELGDSQIKSDAASALGCAYRLQGDFPRALDFHKLDLEISSGGKIIQKKIFFSS